MDRPIELVPLQCIKCSTRIPAASDEIAWVCEQCGQGMYLDEIKGLLPLDVNYTIGIPINTPGKPYWVADGRVTLQTRESYTSGKQEFEESGLFWGQPRRFFIQASTVASLEELLTTGTNLLIAPPQLKPGPAARFSPVTRSPNDVRAIAEFIIMAVEAGRKDKLKQVEFTLTLSPPSLWILP